MTGRVSKFPEAVGMALMAPFAMLLVAYGGWTLFAAATRSNLTLGEIQLGALALLAGCLLVVCLAALFGHRLFLPKGAAPRRPSRPSR